MVGRTADSKVVLSAAMMAASMAARKADSTAEWKADWTAVWKGPRMVAMRAEAMADSTAE